MGSLPQAYHPKKSAIIANVVSTQPATIKNRNLSKLFILALPFDDQRPTRLASMLELLFLAITFRQ